MLRSWVRRVSLTPRWEADLLVTTFNIPNFEFLTASLVISFEPLFLELVLDGADLGLSTGWRDRGMETPSGYEDTQTLKTDRLRGTSQDNQGIHACLSSH